MSGCGCHPGATTGEEGRTLRIALALNATMFVIELFGGIVGDSSGLIADSLDMVADASAYAIAIAAITRGARFKARAAALSGTVLFILGLGAIATPIGRAISGNEPESLVMASVATPALVVNAIVLRLLSKQRHGEVHLRASWIFTRADVVANLAVLLAASLVALTDSRYPDVIVGIGIGLYVTKEAMEILRDARRAEAATRAAAGP